MKTVAAIVATVMVTCACVTAPAARDTANTVSLDPNAPDSYRMFAPELSEALARAPQIDPETGVHASEVKPGLFWVTDGIYQAMFMRTGEGIIVFDAPASLADELPGVIAAHADGEPVKFLLYSHGHADHVGGSHAFADVAGLRIVAPSPFAEPVPGRSSIGGRTGSPWSMCGRTRTARRSSSTPSCTSSRSDPPFAGPPIAPTLQPHQVRKKKGVVGMRKLWVKAWITLDGVFDAATMGHWWQNTNSPERMQYITEEYSKGDAYLLGRVTYEMLWPGWSTQTTGDGPGPILNRMHKYVVSTTLTEAPWKESTIISGNVMDEIARLKQQPGKDIIVDGSATLVQTLMRAGLIDEFRFLVQPFVMGTGRRFFPEGTPPTNLRLVESRALGFGSLALVYQPTR